MAFDNTVPVAVTKPFKDYFIVTGNHGGYTEGFCFDCRNSGWIEHLETERKQHKPGCRVGAMIPPKVAT